MPLESLKSRATTQKNLRKKGDQRLTHQIQKRRLTTQKSLKTLERLKKT